MDSHGLLLTIDDGPSPQWTPQFLALLRKYKIKATFSLIGRQVAQYPSLVRAIVKDGHSLANHTWDHDEKLAIRPAATIHSEIARTQDAIIAASGYRPHLYRAPGGGWGPPIFAEIAAQQMTPLGWNIDPRDWARPGIPAITAAMLKAGPGDIILCHDGGGDRSQTYSALTTVISTLQSRGLHFITLPTQK
ncbi:MAG: polysaccharide deacetylase family protein [Jatrophihabitantaceae bacterium]